MDILHGLENCYADPPNNRIRIILVYSKKEITAYQDKTFDDIDLDTIDSENKKLGLTLLPNVAIHIGLRDHVAKITWTDSYGGTLKDLLRKALKKATNMAHQYENDHETTKEFDVHTRRTSLVPATASA